MSIQQAATQVTATLPASLINLKKAEAKTRAALLRAQEAQAMAGEAYRIAWRNHMLALVEAERLENLANADAYPEHRAHYLAEAAKRVKVAAILGS